MMPRSVQTLLLVVVFILGSVASIPIAGEQRDSAPQCRPTGPVASVPGVREASGIAVSRRVRDRLWTHNDSGQPILYALDTKGAVTGRVQLMGAKVEDWEAVAVGPCPAGSCVYVADIGDNDATRKRITIYRFPEPPGTEDAVALKEVFHATYPDGAHDAESLLITPAGEIFIVTKGDTGAVALYRFPRELRAGATHPLERVGNPRGSGKPGEAERITDGSVSADGEWVVLRTNHQLTFHRTAELTKGNWREARSVDLTSVGEPQGEGVAIGADGMLYLAGEGAGKSQAGTFARFMCAPAPS
jgi:hypothetical protein